MKRSFFQAAVMPILLYGCTTWTLTKRLEKLDSNYTRMLRAILNKSWRQRPTRHQLYGHLPPITKTIQVRRTRQAGHCWRSRDELIRDVLLWTPTYGRAKVGRSARTYIRQWCEDTGCSPEEMPEAMNDREKWRERVRDIRASDTTWWWWWWWCFFRLSEKLTEKSAKTFRLIKDKINQSMDIFFIDIVKILAMTYSNNCYLKIKVQIYCVIIEWKCVSVSEGKCIYAYVCELLLILYPTDEIF